VRTFFGQGGGALQMRTSALFGAKNFGFFEIDSVSHGQGGRVEPVGTLCDKGEGSRFFVILCGRLLWTVPNNFENITSNSLS